MSEILLRDAIATLQYTVSSAVLRPLEAALAAAWLINPAPPSVVAYLNTPAGPSNRHDHLLTRCVARYSGWSASDPALDDDIDQLTRMAFDRLGTPAPLIVDPIGLLAAAIVFRDTPRAKWLSTAIDQARSRIGNDWCWHAANVLLRPETSGALDTDLRVALSVWEPNFSTLEDDEAFVALLLRGASSMDPLRAAGQLAAVRRIQTGASVIILSRHTGVQHQHTERSSSFDIPLQAAQRHFLEYSEYPWSHPNGTRLFELLTKAYEKTTRIEALAKMVPIDLTYWMQGTAGDSWRSLLDEATKQDKLRALLAVVLKDNTVAAYHDRVEALISDDRRKP